MAGAKEITLLLSGDFYAGDARAEFDAAFVEQARAADLVVVNLEGPLTDGGEPVGYKRTHLKNAPENVEVLGALGVDVAVLANNHLFDWGETGLRNTLAVLEEHGIAWVGAGRNQDEAEKPLVLERGGLRIGLLAAGAYGIGTHFTGSDEAGCAVFEGRPVVERVRGLKGEVDVVVAAMHWGYMNYHDPLPEDRALGRALVEAGADVVVGHHPHVIQGMERWGRGVIAYSLGNLVFGCEGKDAARLPREQGRGMLLRCRVGEAGVVAFESLHTEQDSRCNRVRLLVGSEAGGRERFLGRLSRRLSRDDYARWFRRRVAWGTVRRGLRWLNPLMWRRLRREHWRALRASLRLLGRRGDA